MARTAKILKTYAGGISITPAFIAITIYHQGHEGILHIKACSRRGVRSISRATEAGYHLKTMISIKATLEVEAQRHGHR